MPGSAWQGAGGGGGGDGKGGGGDGGGGDGGGDGDAHKRPSPIDTVFGHAAAKLEVGSDHPAAPSAESTTRQPVSRLSGSTRHPRHLSQVEPSHGVLLIGSAGPWNIGSCQPTMNIVVAKGLHDAGDERGPHAWSDARLS